MIRSSYYKLDSNYINATVEHKQKTDEIFTSRFIDIAINNYATHSLEIKVGIVSFLLKNRHARNEYTSVDKIQEMIEQIAPDLDINVLNAARPQSSFYHYSANKTLAQTAASLHESIFVSRCLPLKTKNHLLHHSLKLPADHFYRDRNKLFRTLREGSVEEITQMLNCINFPHSTNQGTIVDRNTLIQCLCDSERLVVGKGIKIANWFLDLCERDFKKGKYLFEEFYEDIKCEMVIDNKTSQKKGLEFLLAYTTKKSKSSVTIAQKLKTVQAAISQLEKDTIDQALQLSLFETADMPVPTSARGSAQIKKHKI